MDSGADDYVTKPFGMMELVSRIRAVLRRSGVTEDNELYSYRSVLLDTRKHNVTVNGKVVDLTLKEFELLKLLMKNAGAVLTKGHVVGEYLGI